MLKLWLFTDTHLFRREPMPAKDPHDDQKTQLESGPILDAALADFLAEPDCDILLIAGDLTCNGHAEEHRALIEKLRRVQNEQARGVSKRVILITATHDYGLTHIGDKNETGLPPLEHPEGKVFRHEMRGLYDEFGFADAVARFEADGGLSYVAQLAPGYRLLCLNDDGDGRAFCGYSEPQMQWILGQVEQARADGEAIFAMTHHPSLPPSPIYPLISSRDMLGGWENATRRLADAGLRVMFTGHTHMLNIAGMTTPAGSRYWDVNTSSLAGYPGVFRVIELDGRRMRVTTRAIEDFDWDRGGLTVREYLKRHFDFLLRTIVESAADDIGKLADHAGGFSVERETIHKLRLPITVAGKFVNRVTLGGVGALLLCRRRVPKSVRKQSVKELLLELMRNIYGGEERYSPDTPVGQSLLAFAARAQFFLKKKLAGTPLADLPAFLLSLIYDPTPDDYLEIDL
ncbi:MAG: metallophosphoesterase [Oscillospiraceae bacterium]|jgi:3',5'-cyclic AMP phosphodiesterase CpdA|nr:metallophosphoesterase [Oscillospiraceae bacterium]